MNYYRNHIIDFADISAPLDSLRNHTKGPFNWLKPQILAFKILKQRLLRYTSLQFFDGSKPLALFTDASLIGLGAWLAHPEVDESGKTEMKPLMFISKKLNPAQSSYSATKLELLAIVWSLNKLDRYLHGKRFTIYTDYKALTFLWTQTTLNPMPKRWYD